MSNDPIGISGGLNLYEFCGNNPVNYVDPEGLFFAPAIAVPVFFGVAAAGVILYPYVKDATDKVIDAVEEVIRDARDRIRDLVNQYREHDTNKTPSNKPVHDKAQTRRKNDQERSKKLPNSGGGKRRRPDDNNGIMPPYWPYELNDPYKPDQCAE